MATIRLLVRVNNPIVRIWAQIGHDHEWRTLEARDLDYAEWLAVESFCRRHDIEVRYEAEVA